MAKQTEMRLTGEQWTRWQNVKEYEFRSGLRGAACNRALEIGRAVTIRAPGGKKLCRCAANGEVNDLAHDDL